MDFDYKDGVPAIKEPLMKLAAFRIAAIYAIYGLRLTITSTTDGKHMEGSLHYCGLAIDIRTRNIPKEQFPPLFQDVLNALKQCSDCFQVIKKETHIHIEFDRRKT